MKNNNFYWVEKKIFIFFLFCTVMGNINTLFAQDYLNICATEENIDPNLQGVFSNSIDPNYLSNTDPVVLNVYFWIVKDQYGNDHPNDLTEHRALEGIQHLNITFNSIGIFFKYRGIESFNSPPDLLHQIYNYDIGDCQYLPNNQNPEIDPDGFSRISQCQLGEFYTYASTNGYRHNDAINIYIPHATTDFGGAALNRIMTVTHPWGLTTSTFVHELGHNFGLFHTFGGWIKLNPDGTVDENYTGCEHVTRNPSDSNYNADASGDWVTDTPAIPSFRFEYCYLNGLPESQCTTPPNNFYYYDQLNCEYIGAGDPYYRGDCEGTLYQISPTDARNYMGYNSSGCSDNFTVGQSVRMKDFISTNSQLQAATTTIASLYEPYKGVYLSGINCTDPPLFQPGFEYKFVECHCDCPQPAEYGAFFNSNYNNVLKFVSPYETVFESISHPNHTAISIREIDIANQYAQIQKCWDDSGSIASFGTIIKFNDNVFNTNVTITPQDSTSINNPQLIDNLQPGLYNIIENYENGGTQETVILKENN